MFILLDEIYGNKIKKKNLLILNFLMDLLNIKQTESKPNKYNYLNTLKNESNLYT